MKQLLTRYLKLQNEIRYLEYFAIFLLGFLTINLINSLYENGVKNSISGFKVLGILVSVLLISKVATRQIVHQDVSYENTRNMNIVRVTHRLIADINDLKDKVTYLAKFISEGNKPITTLKRFKEDIENGYKALSDKEIYEFLKGETIDLIASMSGHVSGLITSAELIYDLYKSTGNVMLPVLNQSGNPAPTQALLDDLDTLDKQIRELRESIELPANLNKQYNSQV